MSRNVRLRPQQEVSYPLIEVSDVEWFESETGTPSAVAHAIEVDFQQHMITLPAGVFNLDYFLYTVENIRLRLRSL